MNNQSMLTKVKDYLYPGEHAAKESPEAWGRLHKKKKKPLSTSPEGFEKRLNGILERFTTVSAGHVQLLDYENIVKRLGDYYEKRKDHVRHIVANSIERRLAPHDVYTKYGESSYVIVFAKLSEKEAQLKILLMAEEISARLLGKTGTKNVVQVKTAVAKRNGKIMFKKTPTIETLTREFEKALPTAKAEPEALKEIREEADVLKDIQFIFRPMWFVKSRFISTFFCIPIVSVSKKTFMSGYSFLSVETDSEIIFNLDLATLHKAGEELEIMSAGNKMALLAMPVHFETLARKNRRMEYVGKCEEILSKFKDKVVFEIVGLPEGVPDTRLSEFFSALNPYCRSVLARFDLEHVNFLGYHAAGIHAVGMDIFDSHLSEKEIMERLDKFVEAANKSSLKTYVHGVKTISLNTAVISMGFDYVDGYAVTSAAESVNSAYKLEMKDIYASA